MTTISNASLADLFEGQRLMAILRGFGSERSVELAQQAWDLGIDCVEVPIQSPADLEALRAVVAAGGAAGKSVGAGTVVSLEHVRQAKAAGAAFTVSPGYDVAVSRASFDAGMPPLPGVATASDVQAAAWTPPMPRNTSPGACTWSPSAQHWPIQTSFRVWQPSPAADPSG